MFFHQFGAMSKIFGIFEFLGSFGLFHGGDSYIAQNFSPISGKMISVNC